MDPKTLDTRMVQISHPLDADDPIPNIMHFQEGFDHGGIALDPRKDQEKLHKVQVKVVGLRFEDNFNQLGLNPSHPGHHCTTREIFLEFESVAEARSVIKLKFPITWRMDGTPGNFTPFWPVRSVKTRATYREIGQMVRELADINQQLEDAGAILVPPTASVQERARIYRLPDACIEAAQYDTELAIIMDRCEKAKESNDVASYGPALLDLQTFLASKTKVNKRKLQDQIDELTGKKQDLLYKLGSVNKSDYFFTYYRGYKNKRSKWEPFA